jgi:hypothetical protein
MMVGILLKKFEAYSSEKSYRFHYTICLVFLILYFSIIIFGFAPVSQIINSSGFSTEDLQSAISRDEVIIIVNSWNSSIQYVNLLYLLDFMFIFVGILLFFSVNALLMKKFKSIDKFTMLPKIGLMLTIISRFSDIIENTFSIIIYTNPVSFNPVLLQLIPIVSLIKWIFVGLEYSLIIIGIIIYSVNRTQNP